MTVIHPNDIALWNAFTDQTLPAEDWTHTAHLRIAFLFNRRHPLDEAHLLLRVAIIKLNAAHRLIETATRGYHDTMTRVWLVLVKEAMAKTPDIEDSNILCATHATLLSRDAPLLYYSRDRLMSTAARARFVAPDIRPLPDLAGEGKYFR